jgi:hypothetical protein
MATVLVDIATKGDGAPVEVPGLGVCRNRQEKEVSGEQVMLFEAQGFSFPEDGNLVIKVEEPAASQGPVDEDTEFVPVQPDQVQTPQTTVDEAHTNAGFVGGEEV